MHPVVPVALKGMTKKKSNIKKKNWMQEKMLKITAVV